jgi:phage baseplate assembly protein W
MNENNSFLGKGWSFPPTFNKGSRKVEILEGAEDIASSLQILLSTTLGERVMQPRYGCNLVDMLFENLTTTLHTEMLNRIQKAILVYEPRIDLKKVDLIPQDYGSSLVMISIDYVVRSTNTRSNLVFPFYQTESGII